jgi:NADH:quinone reductase (non-electrogenic)
VVKASPLADTLKLPKGRGGRVIVQPDLTLEEYPEVYVIGDMAYIEEDGAPLPNVAQVAMQTGAYASRAILRRERGESRPEPFKYFDLGSMAVIGRGSAVAKIFGVSLTGIFAWFVWLGLHLAQLIGFRNRLVVLLNWAYDYLFFDRKVRLITWTRKEGR